MIICSLFDNFLADKWKQEDRKLKFNMNCRIRFIRVDGREMQVGAIITML